MSNVVRNSVQLRERSVHKSIVAVDEAGDRCVSFKKIPEEMFHLFFHRGLQIIVVVGCRDRTIRRHIAKSPNVQPTIEKAFYKFVGSRIPKKTLDFGKKHFALQNFTGFRLLQ